MIKKATDMFPVGSTVQCLIMKHKERIPANCVLDHDGKHIWLSSEDGSVCLCVYIAKDRNNGSSKAQWATVWNREIEAKAKFPVGTYYRSMVTGTVNKITEATKIMIVSSGSVIAVENDDKSTAVVLFRTGASKAFGKKNFANLGGYGKGWVSILSKELGYTLEVVEYGGIYESLVQPGRNYLICDSNTSIVQNGHGVAFKNNLGTNFFSYEGQFCRKVGSIRKLSLRGQLVDVVFMNNALDQALFRKFAERKEIGFIFSEQYEKIRTEVIETATEKVEALGAEDMPEGWTKPYEEKEEKPEEMQYSYANCFIWGVIIATAAGIGFTVINVCVEAFKYFFGG